MPGVRAAEYFEAAGLGLVLAHTGLPAPLPRAYPSYLLAEVAGSDGDAERLAEIPLLADAAVAVDRAGIGGPVGLPRAAHRVDQRGRHPAQARHRGAAGPAGRVPGLDGTTRRRRPSDGTPAAPRTTAIVFGHIGVGNLHVNVLGPAPGDQAVDEAVLRLAAAHGGTISAEHGIGRAKVSWAGLNRTPEERSVMRAIKTALDPSGLFNPGVLFS